MYTIIPIASILITISLLPSLQHISAQTPTAAPTVGGNQYIPPTKLNPNDYSSQSAYVLGLLDTCKSANSFCTTLGTSQQLGYIPVSGEAVCG